MGRFMATWSGKGFYTPQELAWCFQTKPQDILTTANFGSFMARCEVIWYSQNGVPQETS